ncbi:MAG: hypothetical protein IJV82_05125 [Oscillospiraceae bacterium]|nr:hypothetical protein [Oscillospiraceae bacterium]
MGKKKDKIKYIDDGRTLADMSGVSPRLPKRNGAAPRPDAKEVWKTYWAAVKMMFVPMLVVIVGLCIVYMIAFALFTLA